MTSLEHVSAAQSSHRLPSWGADGRGEGADAWGEDEVEEVGVGIAVTTADDDSEGEEDRGEGRSASEGPCVDDGHAQTHARTHACGDDDDHAQGDLGTHVDAEGGGAGAGAGAGDDVRVARSVRESVDLHSRSASGSCSHSHSRSPSSVREGRRGESSAATSWTQAEDGVGSEGRPSGEGRCRSSTEQVKSRLRDTVGVREEGEGAGSEVALLHSRTNTSTDLRRVEGGSGNVSRVEVLVVQEEDVGEEWHPLRYNGKARLQDDEEAEGEKGEEGEEDVGSVRVLDSMHGDDPSLEMSEKERWRSFGSSGRNTRHLRLEFKPPSPQPWDEVDAPASNNEVYTSDYYSTLNSKTFGTLPKRYVPLIFSTLLPGDYLFVIRSRRRPLIPHSSYYFGPPPPGTAYGTPPVGQIGIHHPREIVRVERDYTGGELVQFSPVFPLELEGRVCGTWTHV